MQLKLEWEPIVVDGCPYDCTQNDLLRMETVGIANIGKNVNWTLADDTEVTLSGSDLLAVRENIMALLGERIMKLHATARAFKKNPKTTLRDIQPEKWPHG